MKCGIFLYTRRSVLASCLLPDTPPPAFITCCSPPTTHPPNLKLSALSPDMPGVPFATRSSVTAAAGSVVL